MAPVTQPVDSVPLPTAVASAAPPWATRATAPRWRLDVLGGLRLHDGVELHTRLATRAVTALLLRLALWPQRDHPREELVELLWPGVDASTGRARLRQALSQLRAVLEPAGRDLQPVLQADRINLRLHPGAIACDAHAFEQFAARGDSATALSTYRGELMPGFYDEWLHVERGRLAALHERLLSLPPAPLLVPLVPLVAPLAAQAFAPAANSGPSRARPAFASNQLRLALPAYLTGFVGSATQLHSLRQLVLEHRLVTLIGPGGSGKTRLAAELAHALANLPMQAADESDPHGSGAPAGFAEVGHVALADAFSADQVTAALARALRIGESAGLAGVLARLAGARRLLVLDNAEQLVGVADGTIEQLVTTLPNLHLLVTSRRCLGVDGEREFPIAALALPATGAVLAAVAASPAVALFVDRARAVRLDFRLGPRNHAAVAALVHALEGMPLAIELAAARLRSFTPAEMVARWHAPAAAATVATPKLDLLSRQSSGTAGSPRSRDARHASMQRTIEWSWQLLGERQRELAGAMTVFASGCSAAMLRFVHGGALDAELELGELHAHSIVQPVSHAAAMRDGDAEADDDAQASESRRFRLYEPIREFAAARLGAAQAAHWRARLRAWAIDWVRALPPTAPLARLRAELPNLAAALASANADDAAADAVALMEALAPTQNEVELPRQAVLDAAAVVDRCTDGRLKTRGHVAVCMPLFAAGEKEAALRHASAGVTVGAWPNADAATAAGTATVGLAGSVEHAFALLMSARVRWRGSLQNGAEVLALVERAQPIFEAAGCHGPLALTLTLRGYVEHSLHHDAAAALALHRAALASAQRSGNLHAVNRCRYDVAIFTFHAGQRVEALALLTVLAAGQKVMQDWRNLTAACDSSASILLALRRWPEALTEGRRGLALAWQTMSIYNLAYALWNIGAMLARCRQPAAAMAVAAFASRFWQHRLGELSASDERDLQRIRRLCARQLDAARCAAAWARGSEMALGEAVALALGD